MPEENIPPLPPPYNREQEKNLYRWQRKLMPWMVFMPTVLIGVFILLATLQMRHFESYMYHGDQSEMIKYLPDPSSKSLDSSITWKMEYLKLYTLARMEEHTINRRYNQAGASMMSGIFTKYLGFFTGMILAIVGAVFIISKLREDASDLAMSVSEQVKLKLMSSSPGIIFGVLGTFLMIVTVIKKVELDVADSPLYLNQYTLQSAATQAINDAAIRGILNDTTLKKNKHIDSKEAMDANPDKK